MLPFQEARCSAHGIYIQRRSHMEGIPVEEGVSQRGGVHDIDIRLAPRHVSCMEVEWCVHGALDSDIAGQHGIDPSYQPLEWNGRSRGEMYHLPQGMDTRVGAARGSDPDRMAHNRGHGVFHHALDGPCSRLDLPAAEARTIIGDYAFDISHERSCSCRKI